MKPQRAPFQPIHVDVDVDDESLERLAREKGVGALIKPMSEGQSREQGPLNAQSTDIPATAAPSETPASEASRSAAVKSKSLELPAYVWTELKIRAAHQQTSVRHLIMKALCVEGFTILEADMIADGRRQRGRAAQAPTSL